MVLLGPHCYLGTFLVAVSGGYSIGTGFSLRWLPSLQSAGSRHMGFDSWSCCAPERGRSSVVHGLKLPVACGILLDQGSKWCPLSTVQAGPS